MADEIAGAFSRSAMADPTSHMGGIELGRPRRVGKFVDDDPNGSFAHVMGWSGHCPARRGFNFGVCQQIAIPALEHDQESP